MTLRADPTPICVTLGCLALLLGCRSIPVTPAESLSATGRTNASWVIVTNGSKTSVAHVPGTLQHFSSWQKLNPVWWLGNADEPRPPDWYRPGQRCRTFRWHLRNPCHNFTFYVIGIADRPFTRVGPYPQLTANPNDGWNWAVCRYKCCRLPFIDYRRKRFECYFGWRTGGNFGLKINFAQHQTASGKPP